MKASQLFPQVFGSPEQIETQWPLLSNLQKHKKNIKEIREEDMKRPLKPMKELDMEKVISDIIEKIK
ncbi:hypothetical protein J1N35_027048 [Gossypium stocksii]|uniref:Uncharacterized protein n=1 Tax=Gossypium stocksii TaxID=47602 RepID=A0A9D3V9P9_9ROSI|nr:hypothetical protein J1N35_027048 [Gossypium stocksii]